MLWACILLPQLVLDGVDRRTGMCEDQRQQCFLAAWAYRYSSMVSLEGDDAIALEVQGSLSLFGPWPRLERMLRDPKSERFVENFTGQWLGLRNIRFTEPDAKLYPEFDEMLRNSMVEETHRFFREILDRDLPLLDFIDSNWTIISGL